MCIIWRNLKIQTTQSCEHIQVSGSTDKQCYTVKPHLIVESQLYTLTVLQILIRKNSLYLDPIRVVLFKNVKQTREGFQQCISQYNFIPSNNLQSFCGCLYNTGLLIFSTDIHYVSYLLNVFFYCSCSAHTIYPKYFYPNIQNSLSIVGKQQAFRESPIMCIFLSGCKHGSLYGKIQFLHFCRKETETSECYLVYI